MCDRIWEQLEAMSHLLWSAAAGQLRKKTSNQWRLVRRVSVCSCEYITAAHVTIRCLGGKYIQLSSQPPFLHWKLAETLRSVSATTILRLSSRLIYCVLLKLASRGPPLKPPIKPVVSTSPRWPKETGCQSHHKPQGTAGASKIVREPAR